MSRKFSSYRAWKTTHELAGQESRFGFYSEVGVGFFTSAKHSGFKFCILVFPLNWRTQGFALAFFVTASYVALSATGVA